MLFLAELYWQFCHDVNSEDVSGLKSFEVNGKTYEVSEAEARLLGYKARGCDIQVAYIGEVLAGFLIYQRIFDTLIAVRCLYAEPWSSGLKLGKRLVSSLRPLPTQLIFQSRKTAQPVRMLSITADRRSRISECEHFETWLMNWEE